MGAALWCRPETCSLEKCHTALQDEADGRTGDRTADDAACLPRIRAVAAHADGLARFKTLARVVNGGPRGPMQLVGCLVHPDDLAAGWHPCRRPPPPPTTRCLTARAVRPLEWTVTPSPVDLEADPDPSVVAVFLLDLAAEAPPRAPLRLLGGPAGAPPRFVAPGPDGFLTTQTTPYLWYWGLAPEGFDPLVADPLHRLQCYTDADPARAAMLGREADGRPRVVPLADPVPVWPLHVRGMVAAPPVVR